MSIEEDALKPATGVKVRMILQDPMTLLPTRRARKGLRVDEVYPITGEEVYLNGPVSRRVAILDFNPADGTLKVGVPFRAGTYHQPRNIYDPAYISVSVFATIHRTIALYEKVLDRKIHWGFEDAEQILVVPRAGKWENAFYERESHSLQFFFFDSPLEPGNSIYTSLSRDIVAHETGHAIVDGIVPDLYNALSPQSLALHEGIADLTALALAFNSTNLRDYVLDVGHNSITEPNALSSIAEEFGRALGHEIETGGVGSLRALTNKKKFDPAMTEPHDLSEIISGALYNVLVKMYEAEPDRQIKPGQALAFATLKFQSLIFRALDYLPMGEVSFIDFGRAIIAADLAGYPERPRFREWIYQEFLDREIIKKAGELRPPTNFAALNASLARLDLDTLVESDWAAYQFTNKNRRALGIPQRNPDKSGDVVNLRVRPRLTAKRQYHHSQGRVEEVEECILRVSWDHTEANEPDFGALHAVPTRQVTMGTTLVIDKTRKTVRSRLTTRPQEQQTGRGNLLKKLAESGFLKVGDEAKGPDGEWLRSVVRAEILGPIMRVRGTTRALHFFEVWDE